MTISEDGVTVQGPPSAPENPALQMQAVEAVLSAGEPEFAGQLSQLAFPLPALNVSATHLVHTPSRPEDPPLHMQAARVLLPAGESVFAGQLVQVASPLTALYDPVTHALQDPPSWPEYPALHVHRVRASLPVAEFELAGQDKHKAVLGLVLNSPAGHDAHGPPSGPADPGGHCTEHSVDDVLPGLEVFPDGHGKHKTSSWALNLPDSHIVQGPSMGPM